MCTACNNPLWFSLIRVVDLKHNNDEIDLCGMCAGTPLALQMQKKGIKKARIFLSSVLMEKMKAVFER